MLKAEDKSFLELVEASITYYGPKNLGNDAESRASGENATR